MWEGPAVCCTLLLLLLLPPINQHILLHSHHVHYVAQVGLDAQGAWRVPGSRTVHLQPPPAAPPPFSTAPPPPCIDKQAGDYCTCFTMKPPPRHKKTQTHAQPWSPHLHIVFCAHGALYAAITHTTHPRMTARGAAFDKRFGSGAQQLRCSS